MALLFKIKKLFLTNFFVITLYNIPNLTNNSLIYQLFNASLEIHTVLQYCDNSDIEIKPECENARVKNKIIITLKNFVAKYLSCVCLSKTTFGIIW